MPRITPVYIKVDANGNASGVFPGGVEIPVPPPTVIGDNVRSVTWTRTQDGAAIARISAVQQGVAGNELWLSAFQPGGSGGASLQVTPGEVWARNAVNRRIIGGASGASSHFYTKNTSDSATEIEMAGFNNGWSGGTFNVPTGGRMTTIIASHTGYAAAAGLYFYGISCGGINASTDFFMNNVSQHLAGPNVVWGPNFLNAGTYGVNVFTNLSTDSNDRLSWAAFMRSTFP